MLSQPVKRLNIIGNADLLAEPMLAVVGARKATPYGQSCAERFARRAALAGVVVVSGGAIGCDQAAHRAALSAHGKTVVVLGCGADVVYPSRAKPLFDEVLATGGALVSEAPWGSPPTRWGFKNRNRIIAGLGWATLIVEAGLPSGTFSTADATLEQGKDVFVVPGSIDSRESRGSNRLLVQGAIPIVDYESFDDALIATYGKQMRPLAAVALTSVEPELDAQSGTSPLVEACRACPVRAEELAGALGIDLLQVIRMLSSLEIEGRVTRLRDGRYAARAQ
jgi:DNA processing protein